MARCRIDNKPIYSSSELVDTLTNMGFIDENQIVITDNLRNLELEELIREENLGEFIELIDYEDSGNNILKQVYVHTPFHINKSGEFITSNVDLGGVNNTVKVYMNALYSQRATLIAEKMNKGNSITQENFNRIQKSLDDVEKRLNYVRGTLAKSKSKVSRDSAVRLEYFSTTMSYLYNTLYDLVNKKSMLTSQEIVLAGDLLDAIKTLKQEIIEDKYTNITPDIEINNLTTAQFADLENLNHKLDRIREDYVSKIDLVVKNRTTAEMLRKQLDEGLQDIGNFEKYIYDPSTSFFDQENIVSQLLHRITFDTINEVETRATVLINNTVKAEKAAVNFMKSLDYTSPFFKKAKIQGDHLNGRMFLVEDEYTGKLNKIINKYSSVWAKEVKILKDAYIKFQEEGERRKAYKLYYNFLLGPYRKAKIIDYSELDKSNMNRRNEYISKLEKELGKRQASKEIEKADKLFSEYQRTYEYMKTVMDERWGSRENLKEKNLQEWADNNDPRNALRNLETGKYKDYTYSFITFTPLSNKSEYFDEKYKEFESLSTDTSKNPLLDLLDTYEEHESFRMQADPNSDNELDFSVAIIKKSTYDKFIQFLSNKEVLNAIKLIWTTFSKKPFSEFANSFLLLASRRIEELTPVTTRNRYQVTKTYLDSNKNEIEVKTSALKLELGISSKYFYSGKTRDFTQISNTQEFESVVDKLFSLVKRPGETRDNFRKYIVNNYASVGLDVDNFLKNYIINQMLQEESFNLTEAFALQTQNVARYLGSQTVFPQAIVMKEVSDNIKSRKKDAKGIGRKIQGTDNDERGARINDIERLDEWTQRVVELKNTKKAYNSEEAVKGKIRYRDPKEIQRLNNILNTSDPELNPKDITKIRKYIKDNAMVMVPSDWGFIFSRLVRAIHLSFNPLSAIRNVIEGELTTAVMAKVFDGAGFLKAEDVSMYGKGPLTASQVAYTSGNHSPDNLYAKLAHFTKTHKLLQDAANNLQRATETASEGKSANLHNISLVKMVTQPYAMLQASESYNQYPIVAAMMKQVILEGKDGINMNLLDAIEFYVEKNADGKVINEGIKLKDNYSHYHNEFIEPDGLPRSSAYKDFAYRTTYVIKFTNGDFDEFSGSYGKSNPFGSIMFVFRNWWPQHLAQKFKQRSYNAATGTWSEGTLFAAKNTAVGASVIFAMALPVAGPVFALLFAVTYGIGFNMFSNQATNSSAGLKNDLIVLAELTAKRSINAIPFLSSMVAKTMGRSELLPTEKIALLGGQSVEDIYADSHYAGDKTATAAAMRSFGIMLGNLTMLMGLYALSTMLFYDDDEEEEDLIAYNLLTNNLLTFYSQSVEIMNLVYQFDTMLESPASTFIGNVGKTIKNLGSPTAINPTTGNYKIYENISKFVPGYAGWIFEGEPSLHKKYNVTVIDEMLRNLYGEDKKEVKKRLNSKRAQQRKMLEEEFNYKEIDSEEERKAVKKIINERVNELAPTYNQLVERGDINSDL